VHMSIGDEKGQSLVEFALLLPVVVLLVVGILELGRVVSAQLIVENLAREGARYAIAGPDETQVSQRVRELCPNPPLDPSNLLVEVTGAGGAAGTSVTVGVGYDVTLTPFFQPVLGSTRHISATASMRLE